MEFISIQGEILEEKTGSRQPELSIEQKKRLVSPGGQDGRNTSV